MGSSVLSGMGVGKAQVGMGLLGVAFAAFEHYQQQQAPAFVGLRVLPPLQQGVDDRLDIGATLGEPRQRVQLLQVDLIAKVKGQNETGTNHHKRHNSNKFIQRSVSQK